MATIRGFVPGRIIGTDSNDQIYGSYGDDIIYAGYGFDTIYAGFGNDVISGVPSKYDDRYYAEDDTVSYAYATSGATIDLWNGWGSTSATQRDTFIEIDNATGTNYNDLIIGDDTSNTLKGLGGDDTIYGGRGADTMDGGSGTDWLSYYSDNPYFAYPEAFEFGGVSVFLSTGIAMPMLFEAHLETDTISNFENVRGSHSADDIYGDDRNNIIEGMDGNDHLNGGGGPDTLDGGAGDDEVYGDLGDDQIIGGAGDDTLGGGANADAFVFNIQRGAGPGHDSITDFRPYDGDRIRFDVTNPAAGLLELTIRQVGNDTIITYDDTAGSLTLEGVNAGTLTSLTTFAFEFV